MELVPGAKLGPYEIVSPIGAGGMGEVFKARDTRLDRTVAIKVMPKYIAAREDLRARFEREARTVSNLNHPNICVLYDIGKQNGTDYMVLEFLEGETLAAHIAKGPMPLGQALKYATQIADALDRAHRSGVSHRDVKPANVMITRDGCKVLDFGLAKTVPRIIAPDGATLTVAAPTSEGTIMGTPQYMAPEQYEGKEADARSDIFAFGCVLYEMVTGKRSFPEGKTNATLTAAVLNSDPALDERRTTHHARVTGAAGQTLPRKGPGRPLSVDARRGPGSEVRGCCELNRSDRQFAGTGTSLPWNNWLALAASVPCPSPGRSRLYQFPRNSVRGTGPAHNDFHSREQ